MLSLGLHYGGQETGAFDGLRLAPGSLLVSASMEELGAWEVAARKNASWHFPGV